VTGPVISGVITANGLQINLTCSGLTLPPLFLPATAQCPASISVTGAATLASSAQLWIGFLPTSAGGTIHIGVPSGTVPLTALSCSGGLGIVCAFDSVPYPQGNGEFPVGAVQINGYSPQVPTLNFFQWTPYWTGGPLAPVLVPMAYAGTQDTNTPGVAMVGGLGGGAVICMAFNR
jgi:hypothetical protein